MNPNKEVSQNYKGVLKIVIYYLLAGYIWIIATDDAIANLFHHGVIVYETLKGLLYVSITGLLLYVVLKIYAAKILDARDQAIENEERFREIYNHANDGIVVFSIDEERKSIGFLESNEVFQKMTGFTAAELAGKGIAEYLITEHNRSSECIKKLLEKEHLIEENTIVTKVGDRLPVEINSKIFMRKQKTVVVSVVRDIRERKQAEEMIKHLAYHDRLTDLSNAHFFYKTIEKLLDEKTEFTIIAIDINRFHVIQDAFGRIKSNELLQNIAKRLQLSVTPQDVLARMDNHTFNMVIENGSKELVETKLKSMKEGLKAPFYMDGNEISPDIQIGVASYPSDGTDADALLHYAYNALDFVKERGSVFLLNEKKQENESKRKLLLENDLKKSIEMNQLTLYFQPKFNLSTNEIIGMEALVRWNHPKFGMISPKEFIPIAEESGFINSMGAWIMREACMYSKQLQDMYSIYIPVSVNISIRQFLQTDIVTTIKEVLEFTGMEPKYLMLEITESMTMNPELALQILSDIKELGVKISIDDFGTGFSSLAYLKKFPVDELKIDKSFIDDLLQDKNDRSIVKTIISMAHHLKMNVVAEGVENRSQFECLKNLVCDAIQGYFISPPMEYEALVKFLLVKKVPIIN